MRRPEPGGCDALRLAPAQRTPQHRWTLGSGSPPAQPSVCTPGFTHEAGPPAGTLGLGCQLVETPGAEEPSSQDLDYHSVKACTANVIR